ncbi:MAG: hypothetical protein K5756_02125 [Clostridiales bacterium]|nr:hypothetical protein [Clostridiales bacterium]
MKIKKLISVLLILTIIFAVAACGKKKPEGSSTTEPTLAPPVKQWGGLSDYDDQTKEGETTAPAVLTNEIMRSVVSSVMGKDYQWNGKLSSLSAENQKKVEAALRGQGFQVTIKDGKLSYDDTGSAGTSDDAVTVPQSKVDEAAKNVIGDNWSGNVADLDDKQKEDLQNELNKDSDTDVTIVDNKVVYVKPPVTTSKTNTKTTKATTEAATTDAVVPTTQETTTQQAAGSPKLTGIKRTLADTYGGSANDRFISVTSTKDGGYAVVAEVSSTDGDFAKSNGSFGGKKAVVIKFDKDGKELWQQSYLGQIYGVKFYDIAELTDGSLVAVGDSSDTVIDGKKLEGSGDSLNGIIAKLSASGEKLWIKSVGGSEGEYFSTVAATPDGAFIVGGKVTSCDGPFEGLPYDLIHAVLIRFDADGNLYWPWALSGKMHTIITDIAVNQYGQIFASCNTKSKELVDASGNKIQGVGNGGMDALVIKLDKNRQFIWSQVYAGNGEDNIGGIVCTEDGGCVVAGNFSARSYTPSGTFADCQYYGKTEGAVVKYNSEGRIVTPITILSGSEMETITDIAAINGGYIVSGYSNSPDINIASDIKIGENKGLTDAVAWLLDSNRGEIRLASVGGSDRDEAYSLASNGTTVMMVGATMSSDGDFQGQTPVGEHGRFTSFMATYNILSTQAN